MAKRTRNKAQDSSGAQQPAQPAQVAYKLTTGEALTKLIKACKSLKKQSDDVIGSLREKIAYAVEKQFLHKGVFALIRQLDRKEPEQLALWKATFDHYWEVSGLRERAESAPSFEGTDQPGEGDDEAEDQGNVTRLRAADSGASASVG